MATVVTCLECGKPFDAGLVENRFGGTCPACLAKFAAGASEAGSARVPDPAFKPPLKVGGTFHGLEIVELLGAGGMGVVYKARQTGLDRFVALKVLSPKLTSDPEFTARFNREARAMAALNHAGIVQVFDYGQEADLCFLVMEFVDGLSLRHLMKGRGLTPEEALKVVPKICESLEYAHSKGVIHRDIKPENILIDREGRVKIADFGLARLIAGNDPASQVTATHVVMGTPGYMAPEQYQSMSVDHRADIYSLGAVFYEMLTGQLPVGRFDPPSRKIQVDVRLDEIVLKTLENEPDRRYQRAVDVKTDVEAVSWRPRLKGEPAGFARPLEPRRELRILFWIPFTIIAVVVLGLGVFLMASGGAVGLIIGATLIPIVYLASRRMQASIAEWAGELPVSTGPRVSRSSMSAFLLVILSYALMLGITVADQFTDHGWSFYYKARALALLFPFAQVLAIVLAIIALTHISHSGGRLTGRLYAYLAVFLVLPPVGQIAGYILWRVFDRKPAALPTSRESAEAPKARLSSLAVISLILTVGGIFLTGALFFMFPYMGMAA